MEFTLKFIEFINQFYLNVPMQIVLYCIQFISQSNKRMAEDIKMGLRPKRRPKYRPSEEQDLENPSYSRPNYVKMTTPSHVNQYVSPSVILNVNAKLLVKFVNKSNKDYRECHAFKEQQQKDVIKKESITNEKIIAESPQNLKKQPASSKNPKPQAPKKNKELYNFKGLHQNQKNVSNEQIIKGIKGIDILNNKGIYSGPLSSQLSQLQSLCNLKSLSSQSLLQPPNPNLFQFNPTIQKPSSFQSRPISTSRPQNQQKQQKVFKRAAYHVAIAYHIYLSKLKAQGITEGNQIDPTHQAKLVREREGMVQY